MNIRDIIERAAQQTYQPEVSVFEMLYPGMHNELPVERMFRLAPEKYSEPSRNGLVLHHGHREGRAKIRRPKK